MTLAVLVPVKDLSRAKTRLAQVLTETERAALAGKLLAGVLEAIAALPAAATGTESLLRIVVTAHAPSAELARGLGFEILAEPAPVSESDSVDRASALLERGGVRGGVRGVLRVPLDLPLIETADLATLLARVQAGATALLVPSLSGTGTNGLFRSPPTLFPSRFGPGSLALHEAEARSRGIAVELLPLASLALDVDEPEDLREWLRRKRPSAALAYLQDLGIEGRLAGLDAGGLARSAR
jgi:2-phospho-L-lactate/phosphoenolpyruvate guanylyltransferase